MKELVDILEQSIGIAKEYHKGQVDKGGNPYIDHLYRVMDGLSSVPEKVVGVLHDIIEDTSMTFDKLRSLGYPEYIIDALDSVTRRENENRDQFIYRVMKNKIGRKVKLRDLKDNMDITRIPNPTKKDYDRLKVYERDVSILTSEGWRFNGNKFKKIK